MGTEEHFMHHLYNVFVPIFLTSSENPRSMGNGIQFYAIANFDKTSLTVC